MGILWPAEWIKSVDGYVYKVSCIQKRVIQRRSTKCPKKKVMDLIIASAKDLASINRKYPLNYPSIVNLNMDTLFADIGAMREDIFIKKVQICLYPKTGAFGFCLNC